jgi:restriction system protein
LFDSEPGRGVRFWEQGKIKGQVGDGGGSMGQRRSVFDDLMEFGSRLPVRTSVTLAIVSFLVLHGVAAALEASTRTVTVGSPTSHLLLGAIASFLQFIVPAGFLFGAVGSVLRRSQSHTLFKKAAAGTHRAIADMSWGKFERLVGEAFRLKGYDVAETGGQGSDGGYDLVLTKDGARLLVQCKHWRTQTVGVVVVRELYGVIAARGAAGGFVVTSGRFTHGARRFAKRCGIELLDGDGLKSLIREMDPNKTEELNHPPGHESFLQSNESAPSSRDCPNCGSVMKRRVAGRGAKAGQPFWGCSRYPSCRAIVPIG